MRGLLRRGNDREFAVELTVHRLNNIPVTHRMMFIHWRLARRDSGSPYYGFTDARPVEAGNCVTWEARVGFTAKISSDPTDSDGKTLSKTPLQLQLRSEKKQRFRIGVPSYNPEGVVELDLAEVAASGSLNRHILVQDSLLNATLHVSLNMRCIAGDKNFRVRESHNSVVNGNNSPTTVQASPAMSNSSLATAKSPLVSASNLNMPTRGNSMISQYSYQSTRNTFAPSGTLDTHSPAVSSPNLNIHGVAPGTGTGGGGGNVGIARSSSHQRMQQPILQYAASSTRSGDHTGQGTDAEDSIGHGDGMGNGYGNGQAQDDDYYYVPDPHIVQWPVYEKMFYARMRDDWPDYVVESRDDPNVIVDDIFEKICKEDGIKLPRVHVNSSSNGISHPKDDSNLSREQSTSSESSRRK